MLTEKILDKLDYLEDKIDRARMNQSTKDRLYDSLSSAMEDFENGNRDRGIKIINLVSSYFEKGKSEPKSGEKGYSANKVDQLLTQLNSINSAISGRSSGMSNYHKLPPEQKQESDKLAKYLKNNIFPALKKEITNIDPKSLDSTTFRNYQMMIRQFVDLARNQTHGNTSVDIDNIKKSAGSLGVKASRNNTQIKVDQEQVNDWFAQNVPNEEEIFGINPDDELNVA